MSNETFRSIPPEILDEFFDWVAEEDIMNLKKMTLVCPRWRYLSQRKLFAAVEVDPAVAGTPGIYQVLTPTHAHLAAHIKEVRIAQPPGTTAFRDPKHTFRRSFPLIDFLLVLPALETMDFRCPHFDWADIPWDIAREFLHILSRPTLRSLAILGGKNFPVLFYLQSPNVDTLFMVEAEGLSLISNTDCTYLHGARLKDITLLDSDTIGTFLSFLQTNPSLAKFFRSRLTKLTLKYIECCLFSSFSLDTVMELLSYVGTSIESLKIDISWPFSGPSRPLNFRALRNLRYLHLDFASPIPSSLNFFLTTHVLPAIASMPVPKKLKRLTIALNFYTHGPQAGDNCTQQFRVLESRIESLFMDSKWIGLKNINVQFYLLSGVNKPIQTRALDKAFSKLRARGVYIEALIGV